jgi:hypothetical protein
MAVETCIDPLSKYGYTRYLINQLPDRNQITLKFLIQFLKKVDSFKKENNMGVHNLATVFGPNLLKAKNETALSMAASTAQANGAVNTLIEGFDIIFGPTPFVLPVDRPTGRTAEAQFDFDGSGLRELPFKAKDLLCIVQTGNDGWWRGGVGEKFGKFPGSYVKELTEAAAVRAFRKKQYLMKMEELNQQLEEEQKQISLMTEEKDELERSIEELKLTKAEMIKNTARTVEIARKVSVFHLFYYSFVCI